MKALHSHIVLAALLLVSFSTPAMAVIISQEAGYGYNTATKTWNLQNVAWGVDVNGDIDYTKVLTFNKFNTSLGTLKSAQLNIYGKASGILSATNNSASTLTITALMNQVDLWYQPPSTPLVANVLQSPNLLATVNSGVFAGGQTRVWGDVAFIPAVDPDSYSYNQANVSAFLGTAGSTFTMPIGAGNDVTIGGSGGDLTFDAINKAGIYATLDYTYDPVVVPEPSTFVLLGSFFMLVLVRKNKSRYRGRDAKFCVSTEDTIQQH